MRASFLLCQQQVSYILIRHHLSPVSSYKDPHPIHEAPLSQPNYLPKIPLPNTVASGLRFPHVNFGGTQPVYNPWWRTLLSSHSSHLPGLWDNWAARNLIRWQHNCVCDAFSTGAIASYGFLTIYKYCLDINQQETSTAIWPFKARREVHLHSFAPELWNSCYIVNKVFALFYIW